MKLDSFCSIKIQSTTLRIEIIIFITVKQFPTIWKENVFKNSVKILLQQLPLLI